MTFIVNKISRKKMLTLQDLNIFCMAYLAMLLLESVADITMAILIHVTHMTIVKTVFSYQYLFSLVCYYKAHAFNVTCSVGLGMWTASGFLAM